MKFIPLRVLALIALPTLFACGNSDNAGPTDNGSANGGTGGSSRGTGGSSAKGGSSGSGGSSGNSSGGASGSSGGSTGSDDAGASTGGTSGGDGGAGGADAAAGGTGGSDTGGTTGSDAGAGTGGSSGGDGGLTVGTACATGRTAAKGTGIENFDGMSQVLEWRTADAAHTTGTVVMPKGQLTVMVTGAQTLASGALAPWAAKDRPCMDGSSYTGVQFKLSGGTVTSLHLRIATPATIPLADGGICNSDTLCAYAHYGKEVSSSIAAGGVVKVAFADLKPAFGAPAAFDKTALVSLVFLTLDTTTTHKFTIDDIAFY